ncbi:RHS repeat-associated core domain-containing protein [Achromobacter sp. NFACC18-2]|uniref:RHS repeat-associated core domain-containing protein n=1 Tax=Achromobacter sp. NFACC18-2 TaxID=1564112 RepID=UPI0008ADED67|nr:RHS repeat-associated core domain-containing protein [Achromobacter sp. NFACC18-2]SEK08667.1 RHS repeat-associated core domain-containing protein [Achromobacter sp. NFACC18-2]
MSQPSRTPATLNYPTRYTDKEWEAVVATSWKTISDGWDSIPAEWQRFRSSEVGRTSIQVARYALIGGIVARAVVAPRNTIVREDVREGAAAFDRWLRSISNDLITLERIKSFASAIPIVTNVIALVDVINDITEMMSKKEVMALDWVGLGVDLIGVVPAAVGYGAIRGNLRVALHAARAEFMSRGLAGVSEVLISTLANNLSASFKGDLETFLKDAIAKLEEILIVAADMGEQVVNSLANGLISLANADLGSTENYQAADQKLQAVLQENNGSVSTLELVTHPNFWSALGSIMVGQAKDAASWGARQVLPEPIKKHVLDVAAQLKILAPQVKAQILTLKDPKVQQSIGWMLEQLMLAVVAKRKLAHSQPSNVHPSQTSQAKHQASGAESDAIKRQHPAKADPKPGSGCSSCNSITFARGAETLTHTDAVLPGPFPLRWVRTYRSDLDAYDAGPGGARWINEFTTRLDVLSEPPEGGKLRYHAADGRSHDYPLPPLGKFHYDPIENLTLVRISRDELTLAQGHRRQETYRRDGAIFRLREIALQGGARVVLHYEHRVGGRQVLSDLLTYQDDDFHSHLGTQLDEAGRIMALWQIADGKPGRQLAVYQYDGAGDLVRAQDERGGQWVYQYQHHLLTRYTDRTDRGMNLEWDGNTPTARAIREWADDGTYELNLEWSENIRLTTVTDAHGHRTAYYYDILGYPYRIVHPDGLSEWLYRDEAKNVIQHVHTDASIDRYAYDDRGNLLEHTRPDGSVEHYAYDDRDQLFKIRDAEGGLWQRDYSPRGYLIESIDPLGNKTEYAYDTAGNPVAIQNARGGQKRLAYNAAGQITQYTDCSGKTSVWRYDDQGQLGEFTDAVGNTTRYAYAAGQLIRITRPDQTEEHFERDAEGRLLAHTDALGRRTQWTYTAAGLIAQRRDAAGRTLHYQWDKLGQLTALANENDRQARFVYDPVGRLLEQRGFDGQATHYRYDQASGTLLSTQDGDRVIELKFDAMGRVAQRHARLHAANAGAPTQAGAQTSAAGSQTERYAYDGNGRLILAENPASRLQWFYDAAGNLTREHQHYQSLSTPVTAVWKHDYDELNQRIATLRPDGHRVSWLTYGSGHVHGMMFDEHELANFERDDLHREVERHQGNRLVQTQSWDAMGRLSQQSVARMPGMPGASGTIAGVGVGADLGGRPQRLLQRSYRYDAAGQLEAIQDSRRGPLAYRYDPVGRLLEATSSLGKETFAFDPASNLLDPTSAEGNESTLGMGGPVYTYRHRSARLDNLLREYAGTHYHYDARGNLIEKLHNGKRSHFEWDLFNRLTGYRNDALRVDYQYDALGRRLIKQSEAQWRERPGMTPVQIREEKTRLNRALGCGATLYGWDGDNLAWEGRDDQTTHYLYEPGSFVPLAQAVSRKPVLLHQQPVYVGGYDIDQDPLWTTSPEPDSVDALAWYQCDHLGTPQELTDTQGEIVWSAQYRAWGLAKEVISTAAQAAGIRNPIRFQGQYWDRETGLHYNRHRYYDPEIGRFIAKDPIGFAGGLNVYQYADNPVEWIDPLGLAGYEISAQTAATDTLARGVHINVHGPGLPPKGGHIELKPNATGTHAEFAPADKAARSMTAPQWSKACACATRYLDNANNVDRLAKAARAGADAFPGTTRAIELQKVGDILTAHGTARTNPISK